MTLIALVGVLSL